MMSYTYGFMKGIAIACALTLGLSSAESHADGLMLRPADICKVVSGTGFVYSTGAIGNGGQTTQVNYECLFPVSSSAVTRIMTYYFFDDSALGRASVTLETRTVTGNTTDTTTGLTTQANGNDIDDRTYRKKEIEAGNGGGDGEIARLLVSIPRRDQGEIVFTGFKMTR